jgi:hypothetical protein
MRAPVLAVGDGALGFWAALRDVWPETKTQRCWVHKVANCLAALPKSAHPTARRMLAEIRDAEDHEHAVRAAHAFAHEFGAKWPKAVAKIVDDLDALVAFYDFPAEHWIHPKTTNPIESTFSTVRLRTRETKGAGSRAAGLAMAFKLIQSAEQRWRAVNGPHLVALVRAGATFEKGVHRTTEPAGSGNRRVISGPGRSTGLDNSSRAASRHTCVAVNLYPALTETNRLCSDVSPLTELSRESKRAAGPLPSSA